MSGAKRRTQHRKHVTEGVLNDLVEPSATQKIALVLKSQGSNLFELFVENGDTGLAMLPTKFRKLLWLKRGDFVFVSESASDFTTAAGTAGRVRFLIDAILYPPQLKHLRSTEAARPWPSQLDEKKKELEEADRATATAVAGTGTGTGTGGTAGAGAAGGEPDNDDDDDDDDDDDEGEQDAEGAGKRSVVTFAASSTVAGGGGGSRLPALKSNLKPTKASSAGPSASTTTTAAARGAGGGIELSSASALGAGSGQQLEGIKWTAKGGDGCPRTVDGGAVRCLALFAEMRREAAGIGIGSGGSNSSSSNGNGAGASGEAGSQHVHESEEQDESNDNRIEEEEDEGAAIPQGGKSANNKRLGQGMS